MNSIPTSSTDNFLLQRGFNLVQEYETILRTSFLTPHHPVVDLATGTGRMVAVLTRLGFAVVSGDVSLGGLPDTLRRVTPEYLHHVSFLRLNMQRLPFRDGSLPSIVCMNTIHELASPRACVAELLRVLHPTGALLISDFNERGFDIMQESHRTVYGSDHTRGSLTMADLREMLLHQSVTFTACDTDLNETVFVGGARHAG